MSSVRFEMKCFVYICKILCTYENKQKHMYAKGNDVAGHHHHHHH